MNDEGRRALENHLTYVMERFQYAERAEERALRATRRTFWSIVVWAVWGTGWTIYALYSSYATWASWLTPGLSVLMIGFQVWLYLHLQAPTLQAERANRQVLETTFLNLHRQLKEQETE